jgi:hypothetical protein
MIKEQDRAVHPNLMFFPVILLVALVIAAISVFYPELVIVGIGLVIVGAITLWVSVRWPEVFLILALWTNFMKAAYIPGMAVGEFGATPYMTFTVLATIGFIVQVLTRKRRLILPVGLWFLLLFLSFTTISLLIVQDFRIAIGTYARALLDWMVFFSLVQMLTNHRRVQQIINALLIQALVVVGWGIFAGIQLELSGFVFRSIFFWQQFPKNDFAAYLGIVLVLALATFILAKVWYKKLFPLFLLLAVPIGWMFTFSRGGFLAILVCLIIFLVLERNKQILQRSFITIIIVGLLGLGFVTFSPSNAKNLAVDGLQSIVTGESESKRHTDKIAFRY